MKKRFVSVILALCMVLGMVPLKAFAAESGAFAEPKVTQLTVSYDGGEPVDLLGNQPTISMPAGSKPVFTVTFDSTELLNKVFVTSTKDGETKYLEATLQDGKYVTDSYFDPNDTSYIPGTIAVTYSKKTLKIDESGNIGGTDLNALKIQLTAQGVSSRNEATGADGTVTAEIVLGDMFGAMANVYFDAAVSEFTAGAGIDQSELDRWLGVYQNLSKLSTYDLEGADGKKFTLYLGDGKDFGDPDTYLVMVKDITSNKYTRTLLQKAANMANLGDISDAMDAAKLTSGKLLEYRAISKDTAALREEIEAHPTMTAQEKAEANAKIDALDRDKRLFLIGMTAISLLTAPAGTPLMISALVTGYSTMADYFWEKRVGLIQGCDSIENVFLENDSHGTALTAEGLKETKSYLPKSGNYYIADEVAVVIVPEFSSNSKDVSICLHGHHDVLIQNIGNASLTISDCMYAEKEDGTPVGGSAYVENRSNGNLHIRNCNASVENDGRALITNGWITTIKNTGTAKILDGMFIKVNASGDFVGEFKNTGTMDILGGEYNNPIVNQIGGTLNISGGTIARLSNNGTLVITGGNFECSGETSSSSIIGNLGDGDVTIRGGSINAHNQSCGIYNEGKLTIISGTVTSDQMAISNFTTGKLTIRGGTVESAGLDSTRSCISVRNSGEMIMTGGHIKLSGKGYHHFGIENDDGNLRMSGGTVEADGAIAYGTITVSGGKILGQIVNPNDKDIVNLLIAKHTNIEVNNDSNAFVKSPIIKADTGYTGGVTYYSSADAQGVPMTIEQAAAMDFNQSYIRLVASGAVSGNDKVTVTPSTGGNVTFAPNDPADGDTVTITVTPDSGYQGGAPVVKDSDGKTIPVTDAGSGKYTFVKPAGQVTITAPEFTRSTYSVTAPASTPNGSVTLDASTAHEGDTVTITVTPNAGYQGSAPVVKDADGNTLAITDAGNGKYTFVMPAKNVVVTAAGFTPTSYTITGPSKPSNGTVSLSAATAHKGDTVTITVTPDINFTAKTPVVTGASGNVAVTKVSDTTYTFVMPEGNVTVDASFSVINFTLAYTPYASMTDADRKLYYGGKLEITGLVPNTKYVVTFDNGLAAPKQVNGRNVIPRIAHVVTSDAAGKVALGCQDSMNVMVFGVSSGGNVTTDLVELYAKNHAGVPVSGLASKASGT